MSQALHPPSDDDLRNLEAKRRWVREHYEPEAQGKYDTLKGKLGLIDAILSNGWIEPGETLKLQCLGISFGDALAQFHGLQWCMVDDEQGRDPALVLPGTSLVLFPQTAISKRVEAGEQVDVYELFKATSSSLDRLRREGV